MVAQVATSLATTAEVVGSVMADPAAPAATLQTRGTTTRPPSDISCRTGETTATLVPGVGGAGDPDGMFGGGLAPEFPPEGAEPAEGLESADPTTADDEPEGGEPLMLLGSMAPGLPPNDGATTAESP
jgi:hypothetical protein